MTAFHAVATAVVYAACANALALEVGLLADRSGAVALSWADGCAWVADRRTGLAAARETACRRLHAAAVPVARVACGLLLAVVCAAGLRDPEREVTA